MVEDSYELPLEIIACAEGKLVRFHHVKSDVDDKMAVVHTTLNEIRQLIKGNINCKGNLDGVLSRRIVQYMACLEIKHREFENLFRQDEEQLMENI